MHYKISVIIPVHNTDKYLYKCLQSIKQQTLQGVEIICIDDASTDQSLIILENFTSEYKDFLLLKNNKNYGASYSRNLAMHYAKGDYIYFMDSDDYIDDNALDICYKELNLHNLDILFFELKAVYEDNIEKVEFSYKRHKVYEGCFSGKDMFLLFDKNNDHRVNPPGAVFSRKYLEKIHARFYDGIIYEDNIFYLQTLVLANNVKCLNVALYNRVVRKNSVMTSPYRSSNLVSCVVVFAECLKFLMEHDVEEKYQRALLNYVGRYKVLFFKIYNILKLKNENIIKEVTFNHVYHLFIYDDLKSQYSGRCYGIKEEYADKIKNAEQIIIYGCGVYGRKTIIALSNINIDSFVLAVTKRNDVNQQLMGNPIHNIKDLDIQKEYIVLVAAGKKYADEMVSYLEHLGYVNYILSSEYLIS